LNQKTINQMKLIKFCVVTLAALLLLEIICGSAMAQTNAEAAAPVILTPDEVATLDNSINALIPLLPAKYKGVFVGLVLLVGIAGHAGRAYLGWKTGGFFGAIKAMFGGSATVSAPDPAPESGPYKKVGLLAFVLVASLALPGCKTYGVTDNTSGEGLNTEFTVPIPYSGGETLLGLKVTAGLWKNSAIIYPTSSNRLYAPSVALVQATRGSTTVSANAGTSTNSNAAVVAGAWDANQIAIGEAAITTTNDTLEAGH
jgi:hypothetical protein